MNATDMRSAAQVGHQDVWLQHQAPSVAILFVYIGGMAAGGTYII